MMPGGTPGSAAGPTTGSPSHQRDNAGSPNLENLENLEKPGNSGNQSTKDKNSTRDTRDNPTDSPSDARDNLTPWRPLTVSLPMAGRDILRQDYIQGLKDYGILEKDIYCIQRTATRVMVTVKTEAIRKDLIDSGLIQIAGQQMTIQDAQSSLTFVTIFDAPYELPDDAIKRILRPYGRVKTQRRQVHRGTTIETGIRTIRMNIDKPIPSYIRVGNMILGIKYEGQEATCKKCDSPDHKQWQCHLMRCYNCGEMGHMAVECKERSRCSICTSKQHYAYHCPHNWLYQDDDDTRTQDEEAEKQPTTDHTQANNVAPTSSTFTPPPQLPQLPQPQPTPPLMPAPDFWTTANSKPLHPPQSRKGSGRQPANLGNTPQIPTRKATQPAKMTAKTSLEDDLKQTAEKNTSDQDKGTTNEQMETESVCSKRSRSSSLGTSSDGERDTDTSQERTLESAPPTPEKKKNGPAGPSLAANNLRKKHRSKKKRTRKGIGEAGKREMLIADLAERGDDFILLQETYVDRSGKADKFNKQWGSQGYWSFGTNKCAGVGILTRANSKFKVLQFQQDTAGRVMSLLVARDQQVFNLLSVYAPAGITARKEFIRDLHQYFYTGVPVIVGGDFNCIEAEVDRFGHSTDACKAGGVELTALKSNFDLIDIWRHQHKRAKEYTWWKKDCSAGSRLDKFLVDKRFKEVRSSAIEPCVFSDHEYISIVMRLAVTPRMTHLWKLNALNLDDPEYTRRIEQVLDQGIQRKTHSPSLQEWWEDLKQNIRTTTQTYDKQKRKRDKENQDRVTKNIIKLKRTLDPQNRERVQQLTDLETTLRELKVQKMEGAKIRSRVQWIEQGEKPTKFFYNLEKQRAKTNTIDSVRDDNDEEVTDSNAIKTVVTDFYTNLYKKDLIDMIEQDRLLTNITRKLDNTESEQCEGPFSIEEATSAIQEANNGKSPGKDGLPPEFYKRFWNKLGTELVAVLNEGYEKGHLAPTQQESVIRLLYKKDDRTYLKNWRPISFLNADYKIATKILTNRLKRVLDVLINEDQTCAVPNRDISNNLNLIRDVLDYTERTQEPGILLSLDQEKAFDRVDRSLLHNVLRRYGFGPSFTRWVSTIYVGASAQVICNGELTERIPLERGVRQGCPLSPALYVLLAEVLGEAIRSDPNITGFLLPGAKGKEFRLAQYADDTTVYIKTDRSLQQVLHVVQRYENASGARLNKTKTEAMWLGKWSSREDTPHGLKWVQKMRILGIVFGQGEVETDNWGPKLAKLEKCLNVWRTRELSLIGKALIINTVGASRFWYAARVLPVPKWVVLHYEKLVWAFIWKTKLQPIARRTMIGPVKEGGIGMLQDQFKLNKKLLQHWYGVTDVGDITTPLGTALHPQFPSVEDYGGVFFTSLRPPQTSCVNAEVQTDKVDAYPPIIIHADQQVQCNEAERILDGIDSDDEDITPHYKPDVVHSESQTYSKVIVVDAGIDLERATFIEAKADKGTQTIEVCERLVVRLKDICRYHNAGKLLHQPMQSDAEIQLNPRSSLPLEPQIIVLSGHDDNFSKDENVTMAQAFVGQDPDLVVCERDEQDINDEFQPNPQTKPEITVICGHNDQLNEDENVIVAQTFVGQDPDLVVCERHEQDINAEFQPNPQTTATTSAKRKYVLVEVEDKDGPVPKDARTEEQNEEESDDNGSDCEDIPKGLCPSTLQCYSTALEEYGNFILAARKWSNELSEKGRDGLNALTKCQKKWRYALKKDRRIQNNRRFVEDKHNILSLEDIHKVLDSQHAKDCAARLKHYYDLIKDEKTACPTDLRKMWVTTVYKDGTPKERRQLSTKMGHGERTAQIWYDFTEKQDEATEAFKLMENHLESVGGKKTDEESPVKSSKLTPKKRNRCSWNKEEESSVTVTFREEIRSTDKLKKATILAKFKKDLPNIYAKEDSYKWRERCFDK
ncbi:hypothetical protein QZH41_014265, partial [Actinostola sp. cb2023]